MTVRGKTGTDGRGTPRVPPPPGRRRAGDHKVLVDGADTTPDFLASKITTDQPTVIVLSVTNPGGNETLQIHFNASALYPVPDNVFSVNDNVDPTKFLNVELAGQATGTTQTIVTTATVSRPFRLPDISGTALVAEDVTGFVYIGGQTTQDHGSNARVQLQSNVANGSQYRSSQYGNNNASPGMSAFKSRGAAFPTLVGVLPGDPLWRVSAVGVTNNNTTFRSLPSSRFKPRSGGFRPRQGRRLPDGFPPSWKFNSSRSPARSTARRVVFKVSSEGETESLNGVRVGGPNTTPATIATVGALIRSGTGDPNGVIVGSVGDVWSRLNGGASTTLYVKESGAATNTGWVAYGAAGVQKGAGNPNVLGVLGSPGDIYTDTTDPVGSLYVKRSGVATTSGWFLVSKNVTPFTIAAPLLGGTVNTAATDTSPLTVGGYVSMGLGGVYKVNSISSNTAFQIINDGYASTETTLIPTGTEIIPVGTPQARQITSINASPGAGATLNFGPFTFLGGESVWLSLSQENNNPLTADQFVTPGVNVANAVSYAIFKSPGDAANTFRIRVTNNTVDVFLGELIAWGAIGLL